MNVFRFYVDCRTISYSSKDEWARGGSVVGSVPWLLKVVGSNPTPAVNGGPWAHPSLVVVCSSLAR